LGKSPRGTTFDQEPGRAAQLGLAGTVYLAGCIAGSLMFGHLTARLGRKKLFTVTLGIYLLGAALTALSWNFERSGFVRKGCLRSYRVCRGEPHDFSIYGFAALALGGGPTANKRLPCGFCPK
jgi:MFS family permease